MIPTDFFCSWSGGKDSALSLHRAIKQKGKARLLLTMMTEEGSRSRSHGLSRNVLEEQAACLGLPIRFCSTSWQAYTTSFGGELKILKNLSITHGVFGDIDIEEHRSWVTNICSSQGFLAWLPLWQEKRHHLLTELIKNGFRAEIVAVKDGLLPPDFLGRVLDHTLFEEFKTFDIDLCGEKGEYHTIVTDGPLFQRPLSVRHETQVLRDGYWFSDVLLR